jgi:intein-encoded DNA endonuclease-like protein
MNGFFILVEIQKEAHKNKSLINFDKVKNQHIKKYANTILELRKNGSGSLSIVNYLWENNRVKISRGTIEKFYKQNNL